MPLSLTKQKYQRSVLIFALLLLIRCSSASAVSVTDELEVSGFARVIAGYLDGGDDQDFNGYEDSISLQQETLFALQPTYKFSDDWSATGQFLAHTSDDRKSGTEWLYLSYRPNNALTIRGGKLRMPFFSYSDSLDVGYSYPWISPPNQVYRNYLFSTLKGISASYSFAAEDFAINAEGYYGYYKGDIQIAGTRVNVGGDIEDLRGLVLNLHSHNIGLRLSYHKGYNQTKIYSLLPMEQGLEQAGFSNSARSVSSHGDVTFVEAALSYDTLSSFYKTEWVHTKTEFQAAPELTGYYFSAGYIFGNWTVHGTYASNSYSDTSAETELQPIIDAGYDPLNNPLYELAAGYYLLFNFLPDGSMDTYTLGTRWDFAINMASKFEVSYLEETAPRSGFFATPSTGFYTDQNASKKFSAILYQLGWEWVF